MMKLLLRLLWRLFRMRAGVRGHVRDSGATVVRAYVRRRS